MSNDSRPIVCTWSYSFNPEARFQVLIRTIGVLLVIIAVAGAVVLFAGDINQPQRPLPVAPPF